MVRPARDLVVGLEQRLGGQSFDVVVLGGVEDVVARTPGADETGEAQLGEVLGHRWRADADVVGELVDCVLTVQQCPHDPQAGWIGEELERLGRGLELGGRRLPNYLRAHAGSVSQASGMAPR